MKPTNDYSLEVNTALVALNALFVIFVIIQGVYLFGQASFVLDSDITYAEYGRRGFFELLWVSIIVFNVVYWMRYFYDQAKSTIPTILSIVLIGQVGLIMVSALRRLSLYEDVFGLTLLRFYSHSFIFFLAAAFIALGVALWRRQPDWQLLRYIMVGFMAYVLILNIVNPDVFIARQNIDRYEQTGKLDENYLKQSLSSDAFDQKVEALVILGQDREEAVYDLCVEDWGDANDKETLWTFNSSRLNMRSEIKQTIGDRCVDLSDR
jgi:hypothetical protein